MRNKRFLSSILLVSIFFITPLHAGVYKWVDDDGQVHYGEQPGNTDAEKVTIRQNETTKPRVVKKDDESDKEKKVETPAEPEAPKISKKDKRKYCNEAKSDLATINSRGRMREINAKGEYIYLSEKQRQQRISTAKTKQKEFCR